jgi:alpha-N-arabinofuranosidase
MVKLLDWAWSSIWNGATILAWSLVSVFLSILRLSWADNFYLVLAVWAGLALNGEVVPEAELDFYVQDALNEIEFLTGSVDTEYGALRAKIGHPKPWKIRYVEVGNEDNLSNGLSSYRAYRFSAFYNAITAKYPDIQVLASTIDMTIPGTAGGDYHLYDVPDNFVTKFDMFDSYSPDHPILLGKLSDGTAMGQANMRQGEIAATEPNNGGGIDWSNTHFSLYPWWIGSVAEAVFLLGAERNADKVIGTTYVSFLGTQLLRRF